VIGFCFLYFSSAADALTVTRGPYLQTGTDNSITIRWRTDTNSDSRVSYGTAPGSLSSNVDVIAPTMEHEVQITGLSPSSTYYYSFGSTSQVLGGDDADHFFITAPVPGTEIPTRIWVIGDSGTANSNAAAVRDAYVSLNGGIYTDLWLMLGDNAYPDGTDIEYQNAVFNMYPSMLMQTVLWPTLGNHDGHSADSDTQSGVYYDIFTLPVSGEAGGTASGTEAYYSFDFSNIHFICLDSYDSDRSTTGAMLTWLENDLASTTQKWIIAFWHHPPYSKGSHNSDTETTLIQMRENALPILESYGVDLVLTGHSHSYERSFQLDGHYGASSTLSGAMIIDNGNGRTDGDGSYVKDDVGAVYVVAGSSGKTSGGSLNHPAMFFSLNRLGSLVLDVNGNWLDAVFINEVGDTEDYFSIVKVTQGNQPPIVSAGEDMAAILPSGVSLDGTVSDDGLPNPPGTLTTNWSVVSGPGTVIFGDSTAVDTTASFSVEGTYVLRLTAYDGDVSIKDDVTIQVFPQGTVNQPPIINAGPDILVTRTSGASLQGSASDDGLPYPPGTFTTAWTKFSGPGTVTFTDAGSLATSAQFSQAGTYVLRLTADDGSFSTSDDMTVSVYESFIGHETRVNSGSNDAEELSSGSMYLTSSDLELVFDQSNQTVGMRFIDIRIPPGSTVVNAYVQFQVDEISTGTTSLTIQGEDIDNALTFGSAAGNISSRPLTAASVPWSPPDWTITGDAGPDQRTPDISSAIQEIIDRQGWARGNAIAIIITGTGERVAEAYEGDSSGAPLLHVDYIPPVYDYLDIRVNSSSDDAEELVDPVPGLSYSTGHMTLTSTDLEMADDPSWHGGDQAVGMRFTGAGIPPGSTVVNAYIQFQVDETNTGNTSLTIQGEDIDNALTFGSAAGNISSRPLTAASVPWSPPDWTTTGDAGPDQRTPDISSVIQEIIDRQGWDSGNSIAIIVNGTGERTAESYNGDSSGSPLLHVDYMPPCQEHYVRNSFTSFVYNSIQAAYNEASNIDVLEVKQGTVVEDITFDIDKEITIRGGHDCGYTDVSAESVINGTVMINNGTVTIDNLKLE
jgi:hypothetical protein